jgi:excisionase family DNA binding protein
MSEQDKTIANLKPGSAVSEPTVALDSSTTVAYVTLAITLKAGRICGLQVVPAVQNLTGIGQPVLEPALSDTSTILTNPEKRVVESPYLNADEAAAYLGITKGSLYGIVERRRIEPLRGPKRTYRFTKKMLDDYLRGSHGKARR